jgi:hypothetical protein
MFDDVAVGPLAKQPARKDAAPLVVALVLHRQLDKGAGFGRILPWRGLLTRAQPHDRAADPRRFAGLHLEFADKAVALVEQAEHRDPLGHRGCALGPADFLRNAFRLRDRLDGGAAIALRRRPVARRKRARRPQRDQRGRRPPRHYSPGRQAS